MIWAVVYLGMTCLVLLFAIPIAKQRRLRIAVEPSCALCDAPIVEEICKSCGFDSREADQHRVDRFLRLKAAQHEYEQILDLFLEGADQHAPQIHQREISAFEYLDDFEELVDRLPHLTMLGMNRQTSFGLNQMSDRKRIDQALVMIRLEKERLASNILDSLD